jgi:hypothetical protein
MKDQKKMVDDNVFISVMASNQHQQQWPTIYVNSDGFNKEVFLNKEILVMAS